MFNSGYLIEFVCLKIDLIGISYKDANKLIEKLHWLIWSLKQEINNNNL